MVLIRAFVFIVFSCQYFLEAKIICSLEDSECLTKATQNIYKAVIDGNLKEVPSSDPLQVNKIEGNLPTLKYILRNVTLYGMKTCLPELVQIDAKNLTYKYHIACGHLNMDGHYTVKGKIGPMDFEGQGSFEVNYYDYVFLLNGEISQFYDDKKRLHTLIKNFNLDINVRGNVKYDFKNLFNGDLEKSAALHEYTTANGKETNEVLRKPVMEKFMNSFIKNNNIYLNATPVEDVFSY